MWKIIIEEWRADLLSARTVTVNYIIIDDLVIIYRRLFLSIENPSISSYLYNYHNLYFGAI